MNEKRRLYKEWKEGGSRERYVEAKRGAKYEVYAAIKQAEEVSFASVTGDSEKDKVYKIARQMAKTNQDIVGEKCIRNDRDELAFDDNQRRKHGVAITPGYSMRSLNGAEMI